MAPSLPDISYIGDPTRRQADEELEDGPLGVSVADGSRNGRKPFLWVSLSCYQLLDCDGLRVGGVLT